jgi:hypothetical protein
MQLKQLKSSGASRLISSRLLGSQVVLSGVLAERARRLGQPPRKRRYSWTTRLSVGLLFRNCPQATGLTLSDPAHRRFSLQNGRRLVLAVAPGTALAGGMLLPTAALADHGLILAHLPRATRAAPLGSRSAHRRSPDQAAFVFARRIRLRRSADRSSSFKPPHVPYFSGLLTA